MVPVAVYDNSTHSTLVESAISPLPTFTGISLPDGFSFRFDASKGEVILLRFVFANTLSAAAVSNLINPFFAAVLCFHSALFCFPFTDK